MEPTEQTQSTDRKNVQSKIHPIYEAIEEPNLHPSGVAQKQPEGEEQKKH